MIHRGECGLQSTPHAVPKLSHPLECLHRIRLGLAKRVKQWENVHHTLACMKLHVHTLHSLCPLHQRYDLVAEALGVTALDQQGRQPRVKLHAAGRCLTQSVFRARIANSKRVSDVAR